MTETLIIVQPHPRSFHAPIIVMKIPKIRTKQIPVVFFYATVQEMNQDLGVPSPQIWQIRTWETFGTFFDFVSVFG